MPIEVGDRIRDKLNNGKQIYTVTDIFPAGAYPSMIIEWWTSYNPWTGKPGKRGQAFTMRDWEQRWEIV